MLEFLILTVVLLFITVLIISLTGPEIAVALYAILTVLANIVAFKIVYIGEIGKFVLIGPAGVIAYSATFLITDFLAEIFGKDFAKKAVLAGFLANFVAVLVILESLIQSPYAMSSEDLEAFSKVMGFAPRIVIASMIAFILAQTHDVYAFHFWKKFTKNRFLWWRNNASTLVSQAIDTLVFITIAFYGIVPNDVLFSMILTQYVAKVIVALLDTPFMYLSVFIFKRVPNRVAV